MGCTHGLLGMCPLAILCHGRGQMISEHLTFPSSKWHCRPHLISSLCSSFQGSPETALLPQWCSESALGQTCPS